MLKSEQNIELLAVNSTTTQLILIISSVQNNQCGSLKIPTSKRLYPNALVQSKNSKAKNAYSKRSKSDSSNMLSAIPTPPQS